MQQRPGKLDVLQSKVHRTNLCNNARDSCFGAAFGFEMSTHAAGLETFRGLFLGNVSFCQDINLRYVNETCIAVWILGLIVMKRMQVGLRTEHMI